MNPRRVCMKSLRTGRYSKPRLVASALFVVALALGICRTDASSKLPWMVEQGVATIGTFNRLEHIVSEDRRRHTIGDVDLDWAMELLKAVPPRDTATNRASLHSAVIARICGTGFLTRSQEGRVYRACLQLMSHKNDYDKTAAAMGLGKLGDRRALPAIRVLAHEYPQSTYVGIWARQILGTRFNDPAYPRLSEGQFWQKLRIAKKLHTH